MNGSKLTERLLLTQSAYDACKKQCAGMYLQLIQNQGTQQEHEKYTQLRDRLAMLSHDILMIQELIAHDIE
jgi:hypothetical protein